MVAFPVLVFFKIFFQKINAEEQNKGIIDLPQQRDEIGKDINGAEDIDDGQNENSNGAERNIPIFPFPIIFYQRDEKPDILKQSAPQTDFNQIIQLHHKRPRWRAAL
jgi:hypothetical protein